MNASVSTSEEHIATVYRPRWWWVPITIAAVTVVSAAQTVAELSMFGRDWADANEHVGRLLLGHAIAGVACALVLGAARALRSGRRPTLAYSERYLVGIGYGIITSIAIWVAYGLLLPGSAAEVATGIGSLLYYSVLTMELPVACVVGGVTWYLVTRVRRGVAPPARPRRPIEDPE